MKKNVVHIKKQDLPKRRLKWERRPETQITPSKKLYKRNKAKVFARKMIKNEIR